MIARGQGFGEQQKFNDKPWLSVDNHRRSPHYGRLYLSWDFLAEPGTGFAKKTEYGVTRLATSDDGGSTWTRPRSLRPRSRRLCPKRILESRRGVCERNTFSTSTVTPRGTIHLAFANPQAGRNLSDQYLVIRSRNGGRTWSRPARIVKLRDGTRDYPTGKSGQQRLNAMQLAVNGFGSIASHPRTGRLALVFSDNRRGRAGRRPVVRSRVYAVSSRFGRRWRGPIRVSGRRTHDDWLPVADYNPRTGRLGVLYLHRRTRRPTYVAVLATKRRGRGFSRRILSTRRSHPNSSIWYLQSAETPSGPGKPPCATCAQWAGDYTFLRFGADGAANGVWGDMRRFMRVQPSPFGPSVSSGHNHDVAFARRP